MTPALKAIEKERFRRDAHWAIFGGAMLTKDEHDLDAPVKPFPDLLYLRATLDLLLVSGGLLAPQAATYALEAGVSLAYLLHLADTRILFIEKSRQMLVSWLLVAYLLWRGKTRPHQLILVQSKREEDAASLVYTKDPTTARMSFLETHLPKHLRSIPFPAGAAYANLYDQNGTRWWAIPEGGHLIRSNTPSVVFSDEAAFQPEFGAAYTAALPAIKGGGQFLAVSSAHPGEFADLIREAA